MSIEVLKGLWYIKEFITLRPAGLTWAPVRLYNDIGHQGRTLCRKCTVEAHRISVYAVGTDCKPKALSERANATNLEEGSSLRRLKDGIGLTCEARTFLLRAAGCCWLVGLGPYVYDAGAGYNGEGCTMKLGPAGEGRGLCCCSWELVVGMLPL